MSTTRFASFVISCIVALTFASSCTRAEADRKHSGGHRSDVVTQDGALVRGKIAKVEPDVVTLTGERPNLTTEIARDRITEVKRVDPSIDDEKPRSCAGGARRGDAHRHHSRQHRPRRAPRHGASRRIRAASKSA